MVVRSTLWHPSRPPRRRQKACFPDGLSEPFSVFVFVRCFAFSATSSCCFCFLVVDGVGGAAGLLYSGGSFDLV
ncbi:hypothetical protein L195_g057519, partial [Trifolium pratense]